MTTPATLPLYAGTPMAAELLLRQEILLGLVALAADARRCGELFARFDELEQGTHAETAAAFTARLRDLVHGRAPVQVRLGYPRGEMDLPCFGLVEQSANEVDQTATMGDRLGKEYEVIGTPAADDWTASEVFAHDVRGNQWSVAVQVSTWATTPEDSMILAAALRVVVLDAKPRLQHAGIEELTMSEGGVQVDGDLAPLVGYVPVLTVRLDYTRRQTRRRKVPTRVSLSITFE